VARFVLVHGAWLGGWCWQPLARELEQRGHAVDAPDLPCDDVTKTQHDYAVVVGPQPDAVVVGHSLAGQTIPLVAARARVYLAAILPVEDVYEVAFAPGWAGAARDELGRSHWPELESAAARLFPDCDRATVEWAFPRLRAQGRIVTEAQPLHDEDVAVVCRHDAIVSPEWQLATGRKLFRTVLELDTGHFPMLTHPAELADLLEQLA
jgi:pimeloyl-ACP methyl ester carboxylesterase